VVGAIVRSITYAAADWLVSTGGGHHRKESRGPLTHVLLFMELASSKALIWLAAFAGLVFVAALFSLTLADVLARAG
jgi:hypothetical protein